MKTSKTRNVLELEDGEKAVISGVVATPANVQYYGYKRNRLRFSIKQGDQVIAVNFFQSTLFSRQNRGSANSSDFWEMGQGKRQFDGDEALGSGRR